MLKTTYCIYSPDQYTGSAWRNGQGETTELLRANILGGDEFAWRLSKARVESDGAFSIFSGYDRTLVLFAGNGAVLTHGVEPQKQQTTLARRFSITRFCGEQETQSSLIDGAVINFNIMTRKNHCYCEVQVLNTPTFPRAQTGADVTLIYAVDNAIEVAIGAETLTIAKDYLLAIQGRSLIKHLKGTGIYSHIFYVGDQAAALN